VLAYSVDVQDRRQILSSVQLWGLVWFSISTVSAAVFFAPGIDALVSAWATPEYSHGPLIPVLSAFLFLRHLKDVPIELSPVTDRGSGVFLMIAALLLGGLGRIIQVPDFVAYAMILWVGAMILISFGWKQGWQFWPGVLHLIYMLPLPGVLYYGLSTYLQGVSSQLGVYFLQLLGVSVFLDGNIIDLGVYKLHVAEACSGLRYLFPILSFSYIFAVLYRGPMWHKAVLLVSAAPITVLMNSVRIAIIGVFVENSGLEHVEGLTHFLEGWVIFITCVVILFLLARIMLFLHPDKKGLIEALDLDFDGLFPQALRLGLIQPSAALIGTTLLVCGITTASQLIPPRPLAIVDREPFVLFPSEIGNWSVGTQQRLTPDVERTLAADDYISTSLNNRSAAAPVELFVAWYKDQTQAGTHSPTVCLPGGGWEIADISQIRVLENSDVAQPFSLNRVIIQKGLQRMLVYYWYDQRGERTQSSLLTRATVTWSKLTTGRADGALVRLITTIGPNESDGAAEARLQDGLETVIKILPRFLPGT